MAGASGRNYLTIQYVAIVDCVTVITLIAELVLV